MDFYTDETRERIAALICDEWAKRVRELRHAERKLEAWRDTQRKEES